MLDVLGGMLGVLGAGSQRQGVTPEETDTEGSKPTIRSWLSSAYITHAIASCLWLLTQVAPMAFNLALDNAGNSSAAKTAIMAITTSNSIRVKPRFIPVVFLGSLFVFCAKRREQKASPPTLPAA